MIRKFRNKLTQDDAKYILEKLKKAIESNNANDNDIKLHIKKIDESILNYVY